MELVERIKLLAAEYHAETVAIRRELHAHPELSFQEVQTSAFIAHQLGLWKIPVTTGIAKTGLVGIIEGKNPGKKTIALRADMDALPILEANDVPYKSTLKGVMHACGHDVHSASLLGAARILAELRNEFEGTVKLIFQPSEELLPGGASVMIKEGVLENPKPASIFAQHVYPSLETGKVGFRPGRYMASTDEIYVTVHGKGGHGAMPHLAIDPVLIAAHIIVSLQQIISRNANPLTPCVLTFGKVIANGATNIIPDEVKMEGTFRTFDEAWRKDAHARMKKMAEQIAEAMGGSCEFTIVAGYPFLSNDVPLTKNAITYAREFLGAENVVDLDMRMTAEDFAWYSYHLPACFYRLGTGNKAKGITSPVHTSTFDIDEKALEIGAGLLAWIAVRELGN